VIIAKRVYEPYDPADGYRVLVDRLWPRGVSKERAHIDAWEKDIAPSRELREWYSHDPDRWPEFQKRYLAELRTQAARVVLDDLVRRAGTGRVTLVYASRAGDISDAAVLERLLGRRARRSGGTGPAKAAAPAGTTGTAKAARKDARATK
jgi:uncharacterized protein YeaO (DUF488 family)